MTAFEAYRREQWRRAMAHRFCAACGMPLFQGGAAHIIANTDRNNSRYSRWIVSHAENLRPAHNGACNDRCMALARGEAERDALAWRIARAILSDDVAASIGPADHATIEKWAAR